MTDDIATRYPKPLLVEMFRRMTLVREFELRAIEERRGGLIPGFIHSYVGQEATAVGACLALEPQDVITSTHRGHGHLIAKGGQPRYMMAELAARERRLLPGTRRLAAHGRFRAWASWAPTASWPAAFPSPSARRWPSRCAPSRRVALAFFGDGAVNEGAFHEAVNMAGLWKLPVIFFCENNLYGEGTPQAQQAPVADLAGAPRLRLPRHHRRRQRRRGRVRGG